MISPQQLKLLIVVLTLIGSATLFVRFRHRRKQLLLLVTSLFIAFGLAEGLLRLISPQYDGHNDLFTPDAKLGWRFVPNQRTSIAYYGEANHYVHINEAGFRDASFNRTNHHEHVILCLGDSFVSNLSVPDSDVFTRLLEQRLPDTAVLNLGVNGYGQTQEALLMEEQLAKIQPDLILLVIYLRNDFTDNMNSNWIYPRPMTRREVSGQFTLIPAPPLESRSKPGYHRLRSLHVVSLFNHVINDWTYRARAGEGGYRPTDYTPPEFYLCATQEWQGTDRLFAVMEHLLLTIHKLGKKANVPVIFVLAPSLFQADPSAWNALLREYGEDGANYRASLPNDKLRAFAGREGLPLIDLLPELQAAHQDGQSLYHRRDQHWNVLGNQIVADRLAAEINKLGFPENPASARP